MQSRGSSATMRKLVLFAIVGAVLISLGVLLRSGSSVESKPAVDPVVVVDAHKKRADGARQNNEILDALDDTEPLLALDEVDLGVEEGQKVVSERENKRDSGRQHKHLAEGDLHDASQARALLHQGDVELFEYFEDREKVHKRKHALELYERASIADPHLVKALLRASLVLLNSGEYEKCGALLAAIKKSAPFNPKVHLYQGYLLEAQRRPIGEIKKQFDTAKVLGDASDIFFSQPKGYSYWWPSPTDLFQDVYIQPLMDVVLFREVADDLAPNGDYFLTRLAESQGKPIDAVVNWFKEKEFIFMPKMLHKFEIEAFQKFYVDIVYTHEILKPGHDKFVRSVSSDRMTFWLNYRFKRCVEAIAAEPLQPTYSYFVNYLGLEGNPGLKAHTDAVDNEFTVTWGMVNKGFKPGEVWPIYVLEWKREPTEMGHWEKQPKPDEDGVVELKLDFGDCGMFRGRAHPHFRMPLKVGQDSGNGLTHFVKMSYPVHMNRGEHNQKYKDE